MRTKVDWRGRSYRPGGRAVLLDDVAITPRSFANYQTGNVAQYCMVDRLDIRFPNAASPQSSYKCR